MLHSTVDWLDIPALDFLTNHPSSIDSADANLGDNFLGETDIDRLFIK